MTHDHDAKTSPGFLEGDSQIKQLYRQRDWSSTPLGAASLWPQALKTAIGIMLDSQFPMFISWGPDRTFLYNQAYSIILGNKHPSALGSPFYKVWSDIWNEIEPLILKVDKGESVYLENLRLVMNRHGFDEETFFTFSYGPIRNEFDQLCGLFCAVVETTIYKKAEEALISEQARLQAVSVLAERERAKFEAAFHAVAEGIFIFDSNGFPVFMNEGAAKVFGSSKAQEVTKDFAFFFERLDLYELDGRFIPTEEWPVSRVLRGESFRDWQILAHRRDIDRRWVWSSSGELAVQQGSEVTLAVEVLRDITEQKLAEQELLEAKLEADRANQLKSSFLANMSHEIRTPLGAILGFSSLLKDHELTEAERDQYIDTIIRSGNSLTAIIDDILDLAKVEAGKLNVETMVVSIYELLTDSVDVFKVKAKQKGIYLLLAIDECVPQQIQTDPTRLRQILVNLIGNAVKFTETGGVRINVDCINIREDRLQMRISIKDTGIGLSDEQQQRLFQPFTQADNSMTRKFGGTGLGLVLSQRLADALGGKIQITASAPGTGSTFEFVFEAARVFDNMDHTKQDKIQQVRALDSLKVLVVDDSEENQILATRLLSKQGAIVHVAGDGREAVEKALSGTFDVVLMDLQMPGLDGYQAKQALDQQQYKKPVIALTAHAMSEEKVKTKAAGFDGHLTKPIDVNELIKTILESLRS